MSETEARTTRLLKIEPSGDVTLESIDAAVLHKAVQSRLSPEDSRTFVYWTGTGEDTVTGRVVSVHTASNQFTVRPTLEDT